MNREGIEFICFFFYDIYLYIYIYIGLYNLEDFEALYSDSEALDEDMLEFGNVALKIK